MEVYKIKIDFYKVGYVEIVQLLLHKLLYKWKLLITFCNSRNSVINVWNDGVRCAIMGIDNFQGVTRHKAVKLRLCTR